MTGLGPDDLNGEACGVSGCGEPATAMGYISLMPPPEFGAVDADSPMRFDVTLCLNHAHLLRADTTLDGVANGLA